MAVNLKFELNVETQDFDFNCFQESYSMCFAYILDMRKRMFAGR